MAVVTPARLHKLRLNAGRLNFVAPTAPHTPTPQDGSRAGPLTLSWLCDGGQLFDVYFGTTASPPLVGTTPSKAWVAPPLTIGTVYYWRIVARANPLGAAASGPVWSFTAAVPVAPISPFPAHHATNVPTAVTLSWTQPLTVPGDIVFDVYFGTTPSTKTLVSLNQAATTFNPGPLAGGVDYYWRVVARNNVGTTSGPTWTFETRNPTVGLITIGGVDVRGRVRIADMHVRDLLADTPNTASFTIEGSPPTVGQEVRIGLATLAGDDVIFGGYLDSVDAIYEGRPVNRAWRVTAQDYVYGLDRLKVRIRYGQQSATTIAQDLLARYAPLGYTGHAIAAGLPIVTGGIDFTEEDLTKCFARLAQRIGGYWFVDYAKDVHLFLTETVDAPTAITAAARVLLNEPPIHWSTDLTQLRTRVYVEGGGSQSRAVVAPGATVLPVTDGSWYSPSGGLVVSGPQRIRYTGKGTSGGPAAPSALGQAVVGNLAGGPYSYLVTHVTSGNESPMGSPSTPVTLAAVAAPATPLVATPLSGLVTAPTAGPSGVSVATTVPGPATAVTATPVATAVSPPSGVSAAPVVTQVTAPTGTVTGSGALPPTNGITATPPGISSATKVDSGSGQMHPGGISASRTYYWVTTYANARGETTRSVTGPVNGIVSGSNSPSFNVSVVIPAAPGGQGITGIKLYRSENNGITNRLVTTLGTGGGTFKDTIPSVQTGAEPPATNTSYTPGGGGLTPGTYYWRVSYVTAAGETDAGGTTGQYTINGTQNIDAPTAVDLSSIPRSPDGRVTARRLYRSKVNQSSGPFLLEATIGDNVQTTYRSQAADTALGAAIPPANTTGTGRLQQGTTYYWVVTFTTGGSGETTASGAAAAGMSNGADSADVTLPISGDGRVTGRKVYRSKASAPGAYYLEATIGDNASTVYRSGSVPDASLPGITPPGTNNTGSGSLVPGATYYWAVTFVVSGGETTSGPGIGANMGAASTADLGSIPISPDPRVIARRIYRTTANGGTYRLETTIQNNTTTTYQSGSVPDGSLGVAMPSTNTTGTGKLVPGGWYGWQVTFLTAGGETTPGPYTAFSLGPTSDAFDLANIPTSADVRVTKRRVYRTANGGGAFRLEVTIGDNTTTTYRSQIADGALGAEPPATNTTGTGGLVPGAGYWWTYRFVTAAGESEIGPGSFVTMPAGADTAALTGIAASADGRVTKRRIYRTAANGVTFRLEAEIADNATTTYTSSKRDDQLGADLIFGNTTSAGGQIAVSSIPTGPAGTTARRLYRTTSGGANYQLVVVISDNTTTTYQDNVKDSSLGESVSSTQLIELTGIPASGPGAVLYEIRPSDDVNILIQCDDVPAQQSYGIVEHYLQDRRVALAEATAMGNADLRLFSRPITTITYATRDPKTRSGKTVRIDLPEMDLVGDFTIQTVEIDQIDRHPGLFPKYGVTCSSVRFSFEDALRRFQLETR